MYNAILQKLKNSVMTQSVLYENRFFYTVESNKVFCVNIINEVRMKKTIVVYGWAFLSKTSEAMEVLEQFGEFSNSINLRQVQVVTDEYSWEISKERICQNYCEHFEKSKEEILQIIKDLRKKFVKQIADKMKLLGLKKKGNEWYYWLNDSVKLMFYAGKDTYSDVYYFDLAIISNHYSDNSTGYYMCYCDGLWFESDEKIDWQLDPGNIDFSKFDWQLDSVGLFEERLDYMTQNQIIPILSMELSDLGELKGIRERCYCKEAKCKDCWMTFDDNPLEEF